MERRETDAETIQHRIEVTLGLESAARHISELTAKLDEFKKLFFARFDEHEELDNKRDTRLIKLEGTVGTLVAVAWLMFSATTIVVVGAILKLILK